MTQPETLFAQGDGLATITLNRPQVLNALSPGQFGTLAAQLGEWATDDSVGAVLIEGAGERAFCAGGDIRAVWDARLRGDDAFNRRLFAEEYALDSRIHHFPKPYVSILDGIVMGGGAGVSVNGAFRIATERTLFAMPETAIGFFPDVGATHFLSRLPGWTGLYLGLTGARLGPADCLWAGLATHYVPAAGLEALRRDMKRAANSGDAHGAIQAVLAAAHQSPGEGQLAGISHAIDCCFGRPDLDGIMAALEAENTEGSRKILASMRASAPLSLAVTYRQLTEGKWLAFDDCMRREYRLACRFLDGRNFYEGIRALVVDKDRQPRWSPTTLSEVTDVMVSAMFTSLGENELAL